MRTITIEIRFPIELHPEAVMRQIEEDYPSFSAYAANTIIYDIITRRRHHLTGQTPKLSRKQEDAFHKGVKKAFKKGERMNGSYLEHKVTEAVADMKDKPSVEQVSRVLLDNLIKDGEEND